MIQLITALEVRNRMGLDPALAGGVDPVIESYITSAQLRMEAALDSQFDVNSDSNRFLLDSTVTGGVIPNGSFRLLLKSGFLQTDKPVSVMGEDTIPDTDYYIDYARGIVYVLAKYADTYVDVDYVSGFDDTHPAPDWLKEVLISAITPLINALQPTNKSQSAQAFYNTINQHIDAIALKHRRDPGLAMKAIQ